MNIKPKIIPAVCCVAILTACASNKATNLNSGSGKDTNNHSWAVKPMEMRTSSDKPEALYQIGRYYQGQNRLDLAITAYQKALASDNGFVEARNGLGIAYSRQGKYLEAIEVFKTAIGQAPNAAHIFSNLGYAYYLQGLYAESVIMLEKATQLDPANKRALNNLGLAYAKVDHHEESVQMFSQAAALDHSANMNATKQSSAEKMAISNQTLPSTSERGRAEILSDPQAVHEDTLALPKDRGVIRSASSDAIYSEIKPVGTTIEVSKNTYEWHASMPTFTAVIAEPAVEKLSGPPDVKIEVSNGNGITGMAAKVGRFLKNGGYQDVRLTNQKPYSVSKTQIQYRKRYQAEAKLLQISLPESSPALLQRNDLRSDVGIRLVLGQDIATHVASFDDQLQTFKVALNSQ